MSFNTYRSWYQYARVFGILRLSGMPALVPKCGTFDPIHA